jgi:hypothetical protein
MALVERPWKEQIIMLTMITAVVMFVAALLFAGLALVWWAFSDNRQYDRCTKKVDRVGGDHSA